MNDSLIEVNVGLLWVLQSATFVILLVIALAVLRHALRRQRPLAKGLIIFSVMSVILTLNALTWFRAAAQAMAAPERAVALVQILVCCGLLVSIVACILYHVVSASRGLFEQRSSNSPGHQESTRQVP